MDPVETARKILNGESFETEEIVSDDSELLEDLEDEFVSALLEDDDEEDEEDEEEDEEDVEEKKTKSEGKLPPWLDKKGKGKKKSDDDDDEEEEVKEAEVILDVDDNQDAEGKKATPTPKGKGKAKDPKAKPSKASGKIDTIKATKEHIDVLFAGESLTEDFKLKAITIFETAINERVSAVEDELREDHAKVLEEHTNAVTEELTEKLDDYMGYVVENWMEENELQIESGIRTDVSESFLVGLKNLFEEHYVDIPDEKYNILEELQQKITSLEENLENELKRNVNLRKDVLESRCEEVFSECSHGMVDTEVEKLRTLSEGIEFEDENQYREKVNVLKESYFGDNSSASFEFEGEEEKNTDLTESMQTYMTTLGRTAKSARDNALS